MLEFPTQSSKRTAKASNVNGEANAEPRREKMKIVVIGATGAVGKLVVQVATQRGHEVTALVRKAPPAGEFPSGVNVVTGNLSEQTVVDSAVAGQDVVVSCVGLRIDSLAPWNSPHDVDSFLALNERVTKAIQTKGVKRAIVVSSTGVGDNFHKVSLFFKAFFTLSALSKIFPVLDKMEAMYESVPGLDLCLVHPSILTDAAAATYKAHVVDDLYGLPKTVSRIDLAEFLVSEVEKPSPFAHRRPYVTA